MIYENIKTGKFISRPNRFIAHIEIDGREEICHVKNTGRCKELLVPGAQVFCEKSPNENRKTKYDLIILDIELPSLDGLSVARKLRELGEQTALVFLTSHVEYALKGYEVNALRYLTKPVKKEQLAEIINHLLEQRAKTKKINEFCF